MNAWLGIFIALTFSGSGILLFSFLITYLSKGNFSAKWQYWNRKLSLFLFLVPIFLVFDLFSLFKQEKLPVSSLSPYSINNSGLSLPLFLIQLIFAIWLLGAIIASIRFFYIHQKFFKKLKANYLHIASENIAKSLLNDNIKDMKLPTNIRIVFCQVNISPILVGIVKPTIVLPMYKIPTDELEMIIKHELTHYKKKDLWVKQAMSLAMILHWYNPLIYVLQKELIKWSELSCDEDVVIRMSHAERKKYGETILNTMHRANQDSKLSSLGVTLTAGQSILKNRLINILNVKEGSKPITVLSTALFISIAFIGMVSSVMAHEYTPRVSETNGQQDVQLIPVGNLDRETQEHIEQDVPLHSEDMSIQTHSFNEVQEILFYQSEENGGTEVEANAEQIEEIEVILLED